MSDIILRSAAKAETVKVSLINTAAKAAARLKEEGGQDMIEYAGVLVLVAIIVAAVVLVFNTSLKHTITSAISGAVNDITNGSGNGPGGTTTTAG